MSIWHIGCCTPAGIEKYLSKVVQVLSNVHLKVLKYRYSCTWPLVSGMVTCGLYHPDGLGNQQL